jgi:hypothetical protein
MKPTFTCKNCYKTLTPKYHVSKSQILTFCGKKCKRIFELGGLYTHEYLANKIRDYALDFGEYVTKAQVLKDLKLSSKTLTYYKIKISEINTSLGYKRPFGSVFEANVYKHLKKLLPQVKTQVTFPGCNSSKGYPLRFDFYCNQSNLLIEADGAQHNKGNYLYTDELGKRDAIKNMWAEDNGYRLIRIPYNKLVTEEFVKKHIKLGNQQPELAERLSNGSETE